MTIDKTFELGSIEGGRAAILSIKPKYASMLLSGSKRVELRRSWPSKWVGVLILYSSAPEQRFVGLAYVRDVIQCDLQALWTIASANGGGVSFEELKAYVKGKPTAFAIMIETVKIAETPLIPMHIFADFKAPQSLAFIQQRDFKKVAQAMFPLEDWT